MLDLSQSRIADRIREKLGSDSAETDSGDNMSLCEMFKAALKSDDDEALKECITRCTE